MNKTTKDPATMEDNHQPKIMTKPLPTILDELEDYIKRVEEAVRQAQAAARESREAAAQAKISGEKAAEAAQRAAEAAVAKVRDEAAKALQTMGQELAAEIYALREKAVQEATVLDRAFLALKEKHLKDSPFMEK
jgi:ribosome recycling factor